MQADREKELAEKTMKDANTLNIVTPKSKEVVARYYRAGLLGNVSEDTLHLIGHLLDWAVDAQIRYEDIRDKENN